MAATSPPKQKDESPSSALRPKDSSGKAAAAAAAGIPAQAATAAQASAVGASGAKKKPSKESEPVGNTSRGDGGEDNNNIEEDEAPMEDRHKLVPDGNDFKLVFISSDSSKESGKWSSDSQIPNIFTFVSLQLPFLARSSCDNSRFCAGR